jgi:hypothetical protein
MVTNMSLGDDKSQTVRHQPCGSGGRTVSECIKTELNSTLNQNVIFENVQSVIGDSTSAVHSSPHGDMDEGLASAKIAEKFANQLTVMDIPDLAITKIFSFLDPPDLGRCAQVCWAWNSLVYQPCLWRRICPTQWALGEYCSIEIVIGCWYCGSDYNYLLENNNTVTT